MIDYSIKNIYYKLNLRKDIEIYNRMRSKSKSKFFSYKNIFFKYKLLVITALYFIHVESQVIRPEHIPRAPLVLSPILTKQCETNTKENELRHMPQDNQPKVTFKNSILG